MRVVAGIARGRRLRAPRGRAVRPTADRVKEAVFSILDSRYSCAGIAVLDLFAGTGSLGIEALSRGAEEAVFVESDRVVAAVLRSNLRAAGFNAEVLVMPVARALSALRANRRRFGGVFIDPPYGRGWVGKTLALLDQAAIVAAGGWLVVEHGRNEEPPVRVGRLARVDRRCYGDTRIGLFTVDEPLEEIDGCE